MLIVSNMQSMKVDTKSRPSLLRWSKIVTKCEISKILCLPSTIETRFYPDSKPEEITEKDY